MKLGKIGFVGAILFIGWSNLSFAKEADLWITNFHDGLAIVKVSDKETAVLIDKKGKLIAGPFEDIREFSEGLAAFEINNKWGFVDDTGKQIIAPQYDEAYPFSEGLASVKVNSKYGFVDKTGNLIIAAQFDSAAKFKNGLAIVEVSGRGSFFIDSTGNSKITPPIPTSFFRLHAFSEGLSELEVNDRSGYIDQEGHWVIPPQFGIAGEFSEGLSAVTSPEDIGKMGFINQKGQWAISPQFDFAGAFREGLAEIRVHNKFGFIDKTGSVVIPPQFEGGGEGFHEGAAMIGKNLKKGFINKTGAAITPQKYDFARDFNEGFAAVGLNGSVGYINLQGQWAISPQALSKMMEKYVPLAGKK